MRAVVALVLLVGCNGACDEVVGPPTVEVGTGLATFTPIADGDDLEVVHGPQGGYHVLGSLRASGLWPGTKPENWPTVAFSLASDDGAIVDVVEPGRRRLAEIDGALELTAELVVLGITSYEGVDGAPATLSVTVEDDCGNAATDARAVVLRPAE